MHLKKWTYTELKSQLIKATESLKWNCAHEHNFFRLNLINSNVNRLLRFYCGHQKCHRMRFAEEKKLMHNSNSFIGIHVCHEFIYTIRCSCFSLNAFEFAQQAWHICICIYTNANAPDKILLTMEFYRKIFYMPKTKFCAL